MDCRGVEVYSSLSLLLALVGGERLASSPAALFLRKEPPVLLAISFHAGFLLGLLFDPDDGGDMFLRNVG
jgi:hypothetical protein